MGEKAATNEVITKLVSALGDQSDNVRWDARESLVKMGKKAATNEVISQLVVSMNTGSFGVFCNATVAVQNILSSSAVIKQLAAKTVADLCLCRYASSYLENASEDELINVYLITKNLNWLPAVIQLTLLKGAAVTATENKIVLYGMTEPIELRIVDSVIRQQLIDAFIEQRKRLHLSLEVQMEAAQK
jgi:hypothetical protein